MDILVRLGRWRMVSRVCGCVDNLASSRVARMPTETSITCLGSHLIGCEHCSAESGEYCNEFTRLFAELFGFIPSESEATSLLPESPQNTTSVP